MMTNDDSDGRPRLSPETGSELQALRDIVQGIVAAEGSAGDDEALQRLMEWRDAVLESLPDEEIASEEDVQAQAISHTAFALERSAGGRTFRLHLHIDNRFAADQITRIRETTETMLTRMVAGQAQCIIATARRYGLTWRRNRRLPFPHPLPYRSPAPPTSEGRYAEEAGVIEAAVAFPLSRPAPGIRFEINRMELRRRPNRGWVLGDALLNLYNDARLLRIRLNVLALPHFGDDTISATTAHELLHNLGWSHPRGRYDRSWPSKSMSRASAGQGSGKRPRRWRSSARILGSEINRGWHRARHQR